MPLSLTISINFFLIKIKLKVYYFYKMNLEESLFESLRLYMRFYTPLIWNPKRKLFEIPRGKCALFLEICKILHFR